MKTSYTILCALTALIAGVSHSEGAIVSTFTGEDISGAGNNARLLSTPNHDAAQAAFLAALDNVAANSFETGFTDNQDIDGTSVQFITPSETVTASFTGVGAYESYPTGTNGQGHYPTDGNFVLRTTSGGFSISFDTGINAFGFTGIDMGDFAGQVTLSLNGGTAFNIPHTDATTGSVIFYGFISNVPITTIEFGNVGAQDFFSVDELIVATSEQVIGGVPEPTTAFFGIGLVGALLSSRRRRA